MSGHDEHAGRPGRVDEPPWTDRSGPPARHVTSFNPVFADLAGGHLGRVYGVVAVAGTAVAGLVLSWLRSRSRSLLAPALVHTTVNGLGYGFAFLAWRALTGTFGDTSWEPREVGPSS